MNSKDARLSTVKATDKKEAPELSTDTSVSRTGKGSKAGRADNDKPLVDDILFGDLSPTRGDGKGSSSAKELESVAETLDKSASVKDKTESHSSSSLSSSRDLEMPPKLTHAVSSSTGKKRVLPNWLSDASSEAAKPVSSKAKEKAPSEAKKRTKRKVASSDKDLPEESLPASLPAKVSLALEFIVKYECHHCYNC